MKLIYCSHPFPLCSDLDAKREVTAEEVCSIHARDIISVVCSVGAVVCKRACTSLYGDISKDCCQCGRGILRSHFPSTDSPLVN